METVIATTENPKRSITMEEEKKKRTRPTLTQVRELEDVIHRQCVELRAWREKFADLNKEFKKMENEVKYLNDANGLLKDENNQLRKDYEYQKQVSGKLSTKVVEMEETVFVLEHRSFWSRLFNW